MLERFRPHFLPSLALLLLTFAIYGQTLGYDFLSNWDDHTYVTQNEAIRGFSVEHLKSAFTSFYVGNYAPVQIISYMLDHALWGLQPAGFHLTNLLLHALNGLLFYLLVYRTGGRIGWALTAAALFLCHPVQVESVAWISQRKNLLAMTFFLGAFLLYLRYRRSTGSAKTYAYGLSLLLFCIALLAKSVAVILPAALLLYDICAEVPPRRSGLLKDKLPYLLAAAAMAGVTLFAQTPEMGGGRAEFHGGSPWATFLTMLPVFSRYLVMLFWPGNLSALYLPPIRIDIDFGVVLSFLLLVILGGLGVYLFRRDRLLFFGIALFFLALLPVSQIVPLVTLMNDRYLYFPLLGASWLAGGLTATLFPTTPPKRNYLAVALVGTVLALLTICSFQRTQVWRNSIALWSDVVTKLPDSREPRAALAEAYLNAGRKSEALRAYEEVFAFSGPFTEPLMERKALNNAAVLFMDAGQPDRARTLLTTLTRRYPDYAPGFINLGYNLFLARDLPAAEEAYRRALALQPGYPSAIMGLGNICLETGRLAEARGFYRQALDRGGNGPDLHFNLACLEALSRNPDAALTHLEEALRLGYRNAEALTRNPELATLRQLPAFQRLLALYFPGMRTP